jgi:hypothetical protein
MVYQLPNPEADDQDNFSAMAIWVGDREETTRIIVKKTPARPARQ